MDTKRFTIYLVTCNANGKQYVGQTRRALNKRWEQHVCMAENGSSGCRILAAHIRKYGREAFVIDERQVVGTSAEANSAEVFWIAQRGTLAPSGMNLRSGGGVLDSAHPATRAKLSANMRARMAAMTTDDWKRRGDKIALTWRMRTPEERQQRGLKVAAHWRAIPPDIRENRIALKVATLEAWRATTTPEQRSVLSRKSPETRAAMSEAALKRHAAETPEQRSAIIRKANASRSPEVKHSAAVKANAGRTAEEKRTSGQKGRSIQASWSTERRSEIGRKRWATRRRLSAERTTGHHTPEK